LQFITVPVDSIATLIIDNLIAEIRKTANTEDLFINQYRMNAQDSSLRIEIQMTQRNFYRKALMDSIKRSYQVKFTEIIKNSIVQDKETLSELNARLAIAFDNKGQEVINQYLSGDAAELEKRRYYNVDNNGYERYAEMFIVAQKLSPAKNIFLQNILAVKQHYFASVAARIRIVTVENPSYLINYAWEEINKALALEENAGYIYNELGNILVIKNKLREAEKNYYKAIKIVPDWAIPWSNLASVYISTNKIDKAIACLDSAKKRQL
jgi:tetratricopeptide (TPR) repeat protein